MCFSVIVGPTILRNWSILKFVGVQVSTDCSYGSVLCVWVSIVGEISVLVLLVEFWKGLVTLSTRLLLVSSVQLFEGNWWNFFQCLQAPYTSNHLLMMYLYVFLLLLRILNFSSVHSLHWLVPIVFIAEIGFELYST